jgi:hypothetical protein
MMKMQTIRLASTVNLIRTRSMKVIDDHANISNRRSQHCGEEGLIEVTILKMHVSQFVSIVNLTQSGSMKVDHKKRNCNRLKQ